MYNLKPSENLIFQYSLTITSDTKSITIDNVGKEVYLKCKFNIQKVPKTLNMAVISIFNLSNSKVSEFLKHTTEVDKKINIKFEFGTLNLGRRMIFKGTASEIKYDKNDLDYELIIEAYDGGFQVDNAILNFKITKESTYLDLKKEIANRMGLGYVKDGIEDLKQIKTDIFLDTKESWREYQRLFNDKEIYIDNEKINFLNKEKLLKEKLSNFTVIPELRNDQFVEYPKPKGLYITCKTELNPFVSINSLIKINISLDESFSKYNGIYRISGLEHDGAVGYLDSDYQPTTSYELARIMS